MRLNSFARLTVRPALPAVLLLLLSAGCVEVEAAQAGTSTTNPSIQTAADADVLHVPVGRSVVLTSAVPLKRIYVGNPAAVQSYTSGLNEVVITAKAAGVSSMVLWDSAGGHRLYTISADLDADALRASLGDALPGSAIQVQALGSKITLSGTVNSDAASDAALKLATVYSKDLVNSLRVVPLRNKQVQLKLRIVEVDRTRLEQLGINFFTSGKNVSTAGTQQFGTTTITPAPTGGGGIVSLSSPLNLLFFDSSLGVGVNIQDLEQKQVLQVLAEPTLTTMSGQAARFLSGGEFPFPIVQGGTGSATAVTITFKPYGVKVDFTPTVNPDGTIHLKVNPEVSTLDYSNSVTISGFTIPALSTRRAETEVEIKDGQSFVVSGLLDHRVTDIVNKLPFFGDIPLLGEAFRSKNLQRSVIELVVLVTAHVVDPLTEQLPVTEPKFALPVMQSSGFDAALNKKSASTGSPAGETKVGKQ